MDVYGYRTYHQSDELAKQMLAQQALAQAQPGIRPVQEPHNMPAPSAAPWNVLRLPWGAPSPPSLVEFTGQPPHETKITPVIHCKRKSFDVEPVIPAKQLITEEKMAAHLNSLHISSTYTKHALAGEESMELGIDPTNIGEKLRGHKIVLSEEVKKLQEEPLLPASLLESIEKPHMSLVVWTPREDILVKIKEIKEKDDSSSEETKKRNGVLVPELTGMDVEM